MNTTTTITVWAKGREKSVESKYSDVQARQRLHSLVLGGTLDSDFAVSLDRQDSSRGLSPKQIAWVHVLVVEHDLRTAAPKVVLSGIAGLLSVARENGAKAPRLTYPAKGANESGKIRFSTNRDGGVSITDGGGFGNSEYYGRMDPATGEIVTRRIIPAPVLALLLAIDADPQAFSKVAGWLTSSCCYCSRELTTAASRGAGYGPICAGKYNLPWGSETAQDAPTMETIEVAMRKLSDPLRAALEGLVGEDEQAMYDGEQAAERACGIIPSERYLNSRLLNSLPASAGRDEADGLTQADLMAENRLRIR